MFVEDKFKLEYRFDNELLRVEPWGVNAFRVRCTREAKLPPHDWALLPCSATEGVKIQLSENQASITNGRIKAVITDYGKLFFYKDDLLILEESVRNIRDASLDICSSMGIPAREFKPYARGDYKIRQYFNSDPEEKIFGMGQYQHTFLNLKGCTLELAQRNGQVTIPFALSNKGYGFLWNNPALGEVSFGRNLTIWTSEVSDVIDYWIVVGDQPKEIFEHFSNVTGKPPMMPDYAMGFWQSKLRYQTQDELLNIAREYKKRELPLSVIVADAFHWSKQGIWGFDPNFWPDPKGMVDELSEMNVELVASFWPTVDNTTDHYKEMLEKGYLMQVDRGFRLAMEFHGNTIHFDPTNPSARKYIWEKMKENYYDYGVHNFWLDEAEPELTMHDNDIYRYQIGSHMKYGNIFPRVYAKTFYDGLREEGHEKIISLIRSAWAGSQKYGALVWSGDIYSDFKTLEKQIPAGINIGLAGIPWWTTDIGGFHGGDRRDESFRELIIRWFQFGTFCPVMRLHGDREPKQAQVGTGGSSDFLSGDHNEVWSFGEIVYEICKKYLFIREKLRGYIKSLMEEAHKKGTPVMRALFYEFPDDSKTWDISDQYMFGKELLVAPIYKASVTKWPVYLPMGSDWIDVWTNKEYSGGQKVELSYDLSEIPVFIRAGKKDQFIDIFK